VGRRGKKEKKERKKREKGTRVFDLCMQKVRRSGGLDLRRWKLEVGGGKEECPWWVKGN
jgi:hypothetical protein